MRRSLCPRLLVLFVLALPCACGESTIVETSDGSTSHRDAASASPADASLPQDGGTVAKDAAGAPEDAAALHADSGSPSPDAGSNPDSGAAPPCPTDVTCVSSFIFSEDRDTSLSTRRQLDGYSCASTIDESGPEIVYRVTVPEPGFLSAAVIEQPGVDVDVQILSLLDSSACLARGNFHAKADVAAGIYWVVIDTFVSGGVAKSGAFHVDIGFVVPSRGPCEMLTGTMPRVGDNGNSLAMPATGYVVLEAHLVTKEEPPPYPSTETDKLPAHYALSQSRSGLVMHRNQPWAPLEGGTFYGAGIGSPTVFPVIDESFYVNMYWTSAGRPAKGTKMIIRLPGTKKAVVVAAGYETGPGDLAKIGGTPEESHFYLGSNSTQWTLGIAADQTLPFGLRECSP